ncbi:MAG: maleylpyruvate isomerase N-terminal domain-containing protein [Chloroflexi bacterium]|nr:maleylpyruvate isomerase N-terminal domain-containing protein [Chloroflexota bacterium]OJW04412.1 MAG: hypothetical protein BGO39_11730 [Chloroflexi bacterium 54-19]
MGEQTRAYAEKFERLNREIIDLVQGLSDEQWRQVCPGEHWSVGVAAHHIAVSHAGIAGWVAQVAGQQPVTTTHDEVNAINERHAQGEAGYTKEATLALLEKNGAKAAQVVRSLDDEQLNNAALFTPAGEGKYRKCRTVIEYVLIGHPAEHLQSIRQALGLESSASPQV